MTTSEELLESGLEVAGFQKTKIGEKEVGYEVEMRRLNCMVGAVMCTLMLLGSILIWSQFEIHFERRDFHRQLRKEEHKATAKLAHSEMELWAHYKDDIQESKDAHNLLKSLNNSYKIFRGRLDGTLNEITEDLTLQPDKAAALADKVLALVAKLQSNNVKHAKYLVDHLIKGGKKGAELQKHAEKEALKQMKEEKARMEDDADGGAAAEQEADEPEDEPLKQMLQGFWDTYKDYEREFHGAARTKLSDPSNLQYKQLKELKEAIDGPEPPNEEEVTKRLDAIDLTAVGAGLGEGRVLAPVDIVEELYLVPKIPHDRLSNLMQAWESGKKNADLVFEELLELQSNGLIPGHWMDMGVEKEEAEEIKEEKREEEARERQPDTQMPEKKKKPVKEEIAQKPDLTKYSNKDDKAFRKKEAGFNTAVKDMESMLDKAQQKGVDAAARAIELAAAQNRTGPSRKERMAEAKKASDADEALRKEMLQKAKEADANAQDPQANVAAAATTADPYKNATAAAAVEGANATTA